ncbi:MAG: STAS domain-containing protein [Agarilytica sp.]
MTIKVEKNDDGVSIILAERFDFESVGPFRKSYESLSDLKSGPVILDFRDTRYIDSSALGMLINARSFFEKNSVKMKLINTNDQIKKIFSISRFDKKFEIS